MDFPPGSDTGYACGMSSAIFRITPQGAEQMTTTTVSDLDAIHFVDRDHGWACGEGILMQYKDGSWIGDQAYPSGFWVDVFFTDTLNGWGAGYWLTGGGNPVDTAVVIHTTDNSTWFTAQLINVGYSGSFEKVFFLDNQIGWTINSSGWIYSTTDGGNTWTREAEGMTDEYLVRIQFTSISNGYIVGNNKTMLKYTQISSLEDKPKQTELTLFPNPTTGKFKITFADNPNIQIRNLELLDLYGKSIYNWHHAPGTRHLEKDISHLPAGIYFIRVLNENQTIMKKIIKI
jgi:hypothetical protein